VGTESEMSYFGLFKIVLYFGAHDLLFSADYLHCTTVCSHIIINIKTCCAVMQCFDEQKVDSKF